MSQRLERTLDCHLLTRQWRDGPAGLEITLWAASDSGPVRVVVSGEEAVCFVERAATLPAGDSDDARCRRRSLELRSLDGSAIDGLYFRNQRDLLRARDAFKRCGARLFETDLKPADRFLMERFVTSAFSVEGKARVRERWMEFGNPRIRRAVYRARLDIVSMDIETEGLDGALYSIAVSAAHDARVFLVSPVDIEPRDFPVECHPDEKSVLRAFFAWMKTADPDVVIGWNVVAFDLDFLQRRCQRLGVGFDLGRGGERAAVLEPQGRGGTHVARVPGRVVIDGIEALRAAFWSFERFDLESVAQALLGRGKKIRETADKVEEIQRLYRDDKPQLAAYNLADCRLVSDIFEQTRLVDFVIRRSELTGLAMARFGGAVAALDNLYLPRLHRRGRVAPDVDDVGAGPGSPGGYVIDSKPGLYDNVLLLDFKSLYPSIIRTFKVDPLGLVEPGPDPVPGFLGACFAREGAILPSIIVELWAVRDEAKRAHDAALSQAVKILMNSFYGVLAAEGCRFHDARLASSITRRGHEIIMQSQGYLETRGHTVIYGDTDSLFVLLGAGVDEPAARETGHTLARALNDWWRERLAVTYRIDSFLEIEFETHFSRFLMPTVRGERTGSKKRYAGLIRHPSGGYDVVFKGLESVRTDWTPLARRFQRELYRRVFLDEPFEDFVRATLADLMAGRLDDELVYRKRVRRPLDAYTRNVPPHVQAARKMAKPGRWVRYVMTLQGPAPVSNESLRPDYAHYRDRQLAPAADGILSFLDTSFDALTNAQLSMF